MPDLSQMQPPSAIPRGQSATPTAVRDSTRGSPAGGDDPVQEGLKLYRVAAAYGAAPDTADTMQQINQRTQAIDQRQAEDAQRAAELRAKSPGEFTAEDYTEQNHGLQALPHIANNGG